MHTSFCMDITSPSFLGIYLGVKLLGQMVWLFGELPDCFPKWLYHFIFPPAVYKRFCFSTFSLTLVIIWHFIKAFLVAMKWYLMVLNCTSSMTNDVEHLFMCSLAIVCLLWRNVCSDPLPIIYLSIYLFIYFWLHWVFVAVHGLSLVAASGGYSLWCAGFSLWWLLLLWRTGSRRAGFSNCGTQAQ